ncbi:hypothetical protein TIFTF001_021022 [Ficus carica]|uniref:Uncharacterized protein n=1 Tax=Ficus carica TaxID=3494 RepID=A0AA88AUL1_FICCA|nr:hypothetical protein TIFTF001_021022 [Ficus carica]
MPRVPTREQAAGTIVRLCQVVKGGGAGKRTGYWSRVHVGWSIWWELGSNRGSSTDSVSKGSSGAEIPALAHAGMPGLTRSAAQSNEAQTVALDRTADLIGSGHLACSRRTRCPDVLYLHEIHTGL